MDILQQIAQALQRAAQSATVVPQRSAIDFLGKKDDEPYVDHFLYIYKFMTLLPKDYYLIPNNGAKNLLTIFHMYEKLELFFVFKMTNLKFVCVVSITASAHVIQVIKVDI